jgi:hypothetical protein
MVAIALAARRGGLCRRDSVILLAGCPVFVLAALC